MNTARLQSFCIDALSWPKLILFTAIGVSIGFALALAIPLPVS